MSESDNRPVPKRNTTNTKPPTRGLWALYVLLIFVAAVIVVDGLVGDRGLLAMLRARQEYDGLTAALARQRGENARLREQARRLREDPAAIEEIARRELGLIKPGEKMFILKDVSPASRQTP